MRLLGPTFSGHNSTMAEMGQVVDQNLKMLFLPPFHASVPGTCQDTSLVLMVHHSMAGLKVGRASH